MTGALAIVDPGNRDDGWTCAVLDQGPKPTPSPCAVKVDDVVQSSILANVTASVCAPYFLPTPSGWFACEHWMSSCAYTEGNEKWR